MKSSAFEYAKKMDRFQMMNIADQITQDILIVGANRDHFIPYTMVGKEINALQKKYMIFGIIDCTLSTYLTADGYSIKCQG